MSISKKQKFTLLITFIFVCLVSVNVFASQQRYDVYDSQTTNNSIIQPRVELFQSAPETNNPTMINEQVGPKIEGDEALPVKQKTELLKMQDQTRDQLTKYIERYKNNPVYGTIAYVLNMVRLIAVPFFVVGYLISIVYEFIVGMKRREMVRKGRGMRITLVSAFVMAQLLPLIFAIVIKFWGN